MSKPRYQANLRRKRIAVMKAFRLEDKLAGLPAPYRKTKVGRTEIREGSTAANVE
jgi:hypothetical protein